MLSSQLHSYPAYVFQTPANTTAKLLPVLVLMVPLKSFHNTEGFSFTFCRNSSLISPPFHPKAGHKISHEKVSFLVPAREHSYHQRLMIRFGSQYQKGPVQITLLKSPLSYIGSPIYFLITVPQFTAPSPSPFCLITSSQFIVLWVKKFISLGA